MTGPWADYRKKEDEAGPWTDYSAPQAPAVDTDQDVSRSVLQGVRNIVEGTVALPGNVAMRGAQGMNVLARNFPSLGLREVPQEVLEEAIPGTSADIAKLTTRGLEAIGMSPEAARPYESQTTMGKVLGTATELAPLAVSVGGIVRRAAAPAGAPQAGGALRTVDELRAAKNAAYDAAEQAGGGLTEKNYQFVINKMDQAAN